MGWGGLGCVAVFRKTFFAQKTYPKDRAGKKILGVDRSRTAPSNFPRGKILTIVMKFFVFFYTNFYVDRRGKWTVDLFPRLIAMQVPWKEGAEKKNVLPVLPCDPG